MHRSIILWSIYRNIHYHTMNHCPLGNLFTSFPSRRVDVSHRTSIKPTKVESSELTSESASCGEETQGECELPDWIRLDRWYKMQKEFKKLTCLSMAKGLSCQSCTDMSMATSPFFLYMMPEGIHENNATWIIIIYISNHSWKQMKQN